MPRKKTTEQEQPQECRYTAVAEYLATPENFLRILVIARREIRSKKRTPLVGIRSDGTYFLTTKEATHQIEGDTTLYVPLPDWNGNPTEVIAKKYSGIGYPARAFLTEFKRVKEARDKYEEGTGFEIEIIEDETQTPLTQQSLLT